MDTISKDAEEIALFCRININARKDLPIRSSEMGMLIYISRSDRPVTPVMVADYFKVTKPMVTVMTNSLVKNGYLTKLPSEADKRSVTLKLTDKAVKMEKEMHETYHRNLIRLKRELGVENYNELVSLIHKANAILLEEAKNV